MLVGINLVLPTAKNCRVTHLNGDGDLGASFEVVEYHVSETTIRYFVSPKDQAQTHLRTLAAIAKFLNDRTVREKLAAATSREEILAIFGGEPPAKH